jgi:hypothetical protein
MLLISLLPMHIPREGLPDPRTRNHHRLDPARLLSHEKIARRRAPRSTGVRSRPFGFLDHARCVKGKAYSVGLLDKARRSYLPKWFYTLKEKHPPCFLLRRQETEGDWQCRDKDSFVPAGRPLRKRKVGRTAAKSVEMLCRYHFRSRRQGSALSLGLQGQSHSAHGTSNVESNTQ